MLTMTQEAAEAVERIISQPEVPEGAVLRFAAEEHRGNGSGPARELHVELVAHPEPADVVAEEVPISVERRSLEWLDDKVLDAEIAGDAVEFKLYNRPDDALS
jgi:Fe-S cluster assembly iron-binding protein IscA